MRFCIQVVKQASVDIDGVRTASIGQGMLVLLGVGKEDDEAVADKIRPQVKKLDLGVFGADMQVSLINDGPFTVILDSAAI